MALSRDSIDIERRCGYSDSEPHLTVRVAHPTATHGEPRVTLQPLHLAGVQCTRLAPFTPSERDGSLAQQAETLLFSSSEGIGRLVVLSEGVLQRVRRHE